MNGKGIGFGKTILFGEHFVVYGLQGIAAAIELNTTCVYKESKEGIISNDLVTRESINVQKDPQKRLSKVIRVILNEVGIREKNFELVLSTNMSLMGGMGSSAALAVSIIRCLAQRFSIPLSNDAVNKIAFSAEKIFHENPSGIDNTVSTYGGIIWFEKGTRGEKNKIGRFVLDKPVEIVLIDTGIIKDTAEVVEFVRQEKEMNSEEFKKIFSDYSELIEKAKIAVTENNWIETGKLMNQNQELLRRIKVSSPEIEKIISVVNENGAIGSKITGTGLGGNVMALTPGKKLQDKVSDACEKIGYKTFKISIGIKPKDE